MANLQDPAGVDQTAHGPLHGVRVLDLTRLLPGPVCTLHLADFGADVIKVEDPGEGDYARKLGVPAGEISTYFRAINRNKRSITLDLKSSAGRDAFLRLSNEAQVVVESFRPGVVDRLGVGYRELARRRPEVVYCSISGWGQQGPLRDMAGHDLNYLALAGILDQIGSPGGPPALPNLQIADLLGGALSAAMAILAALFDARRTGRGRYIDLAMADASFAHQYFALHALATYGQVPERGRDFLTGAVPCYQVYRTRDQRFMAVGALEPKFWKNLCLALDRPDLIARQFATGEAGSSAQAELATLFATQDQAVWTEMLLEVDCCTTPVLTLAEAMIHPHFQQHGMVQHDRGQATGFSPPWRFADEPFAPRCQAPAQGQHTLEILREAGFSPGEIADLTSAAAAENPQ